MRDQRRAVSRVRTLCCATTLTLAWLVGDAAAVLTTSFVSDGPVGAEVAAFATAGGSATSGVLTLTRIPAGATIEQAWLYGDDGLGTGTPTASFHGVGLGEGTFLDSNAHHRTFRWDVTGLIAGNGHYEASASGFGTNYGLGLVVAFRHPSLPFGRVVINDGAGELAHGTTFSETTTFDAVAGPATLWVYTNGDDPGPLPVTGEEILFNGAVVGGPIDANLGLRASLFEIPVAAVAGLNTLEIRTPVSGSADNFNWPLAVLAPPTPALVPFARFGARAQIVLGPSAQDDRFAVEALFSVGTGSNGIDPLTESVTLALGTDAWTIPPGSFHLAGLGGFMFKGPIGATNLAVTIHPFRRGTIGLVAVGAGAELTGTENPVDVRLIIGDDGGTTTAVVAKFLAPGDD